METYLAPGVKVRRRTTPLSAYFGDARIVNHAKGKTDGQLLKVRDSIDDVCGWCPVEQPNSDTFCTECPVRVLWQQIDNELRED